MPSNLNIMPGLTKPKDLFSMEPLSKIVNVQEENDKEIEKLATSKNVALIAFVAPYVGVRVSPIEEARATIGLLDEFGIEALIDVLDKSDVKNAYLLVCSRGGIMSSSYKIARAIRSKFDNIVSFVPHVAASGGALIALTGNEIVMGPMSQLTPLDVQVAYKNTKVSANTFMRFFARSSKWFKTITPDEAPYPRRALADKLDPFLMEEWSGLVDTATLYVCDILESVGYKNSEDIAQKLVLGFPTHDFVIGRDIAKALKLNVKDADEVKDIWAIMRYWLSLYITKEESTHCIRYRLPTVSKKGQKKANSNKEKKNASK